jgi:hypothetical protein
VQEGIDRDDEVAALKFLCRFQLDSVLLEDQVAAVEGVVGDAE